MLVRYGCAVLVASEAWLEAVVALMTVRPQHDGLNLAIVVVFWGTGSCPFFLAGKYAGLRDLAMMTSEICS